MICDFSVLHGEYGIISIGKFTFISEKCVLKPVITKDEKKVALNIGNHCFIDSGSIIRCKELGNNCYIGKNVVIGENSKIDNCCYIENDTVIPPETIFPSYSYIAGNPARVVDYLPENFSVQMIYWIEKKYKSIQIED